MKTQTRRKFIATLAGISGSIASASILPQGILPLVSAAQTSTLDYKDSNCKPAIPGSKKFLVTYASQFGSTAEVALAIGEIVCEKGATADIKPMSRVESIADYDTVIIGSPIQYDKWMPEAVDFVATHKDTLKKIQVAYFFTCLTLSRQTAKAKHDAEGYTKKLYSLFPDVTPVTVGAFAGVLNYEKMSFLSQLLARPIMAFLGVKEGDYRDWDAIRTWAESIPGLQSNYTPQTNPFPAASS